MVTCQQADLMTCWRSSLLSSQHESSFTVKLCSLLRKGRCLIILLTLTEGQNQHGEAATMAALATEFADS
jgi:hypothetical protein